MVLESLCGAGCGGLANTRRPWTSEAVEGFLETLSFLHVPYIWMGICGSGDKSVCVTGEKGPHFYEKE